MKLPCLTCKTEFHTKPAYIRVGGGKYCSVSCANKNKRKEKCNSWKGGMGNYICKNCEIKFFAYKRHEGNVPIFCSVICRIDNKKKSAKCSNCNIILPNQYASQCWACFSRKFTYKENQQRNDSAYKVWRNNVLKRDKTKCRIANGDCSGYLIVHHILGWSNYPELRYQINNGITLCQAHHPLKRAEEKRLIPIFQELVPVSKLDFA